MQCRVALRRPGRPRAGVATLEGAALVLGQATPDAGVLTGLEGPRQARSMTGQRRQTALASSICRRAGPVLPIGKKSSGSSSRQAAPWRQSMPSSYASDAWLVGWWSA